MTTRKRKTSDAAEENTKATKTPVEIVRHNSPPAAVIEAIAFGREKDTPDAEWSVVWWYDREGRLNTLPREASKPDLEFKEIDPDTLPFTISDASLDGATIEQKSPEDQLAAKDAALAADEQAKQESETKTEEEPRD